MFLELKNIRVPLGFSWYIWLDINIVFEKSSKHKMTTTLVVDDDFVIDNNDDVDFFYPVGQTIFDVTLTLW